MRWGLGGTVVWWGAWGSEVPTEERGGWGGEFVGVIYEEGHRGGWVLFVRAQVVALCNA